MKREYAEFALSVGPAEEFLALPDSQTALLDASPRPAFVFDRYFRVRFVNMAALMLERTGRDELIGRVVWEQFPDLASSLFHQECAAVLANHTVHEFDVVRHDRSFAVCAYPFDDGVVTLLEDVTKKRQQQQSLREEGQTQKLDALGMFAGGVAHDFNNVLVGILGNASLALLDLDAQSAARRAVEEIERSGQRAADLTRQLLAYAGKGRFVVERVDVTSMVNEMAPLLRTAVAKQASVQLDLPADLPGINVDAAQLRQVIINLTANASDALAERPGLITIRAGRKQLSAEALTTCVAGSNAVPGEFVFVEVRDGGDGIDSELLAHIFDPFFSTKAKARGLGLAATLGIMRAHRGALRVESVVDVGTTMTLYFPASERTARGGAVTRDAAWRASGRVLVVDDEASVRAVTSALLQRRGFDVRVAADGFEALKEFRDQPSSYSLVLLDLTMPGVGGEVTFRQMRELRPDLPIVLMSGHNAPEVERLFADRGLAGFLQKPFRADDLYATVARVLDIMPVTVTR